MAELIEKNSRTAIPYGAKSVYHTENGGGSTIGSIVNYSAPNYFKGEKNPRWRDQIRLGQNASTPMEGMLIETSLSRANPAALKVRWDHTNDPYYAYAVADCSVEGFPPLASLPSDTTTKTISSSSAYNEAASLFHLKVNDAFRILQSGVIAGEWRETSRLIKTRSDTIFRGATGIYDDLQSWIRRNRRLGTRSRRLQDLVRQASDLWLEYSFGVSPLVNDVEDAIDYLNDSSKAVRKKVRAIYTDQWDYGTSSWKTLGSFSYAQIKYLERKQRFHSVLLIGVVSLNGTNGLRFKKLGLHPSDWLPTIYELVPYSFLVDYFTNINGIVAALGNLALNLDWVTMTQKRGHVEKYLNSYPVYWTSPPPYWDEAIVEEYVPLTGSTKKTFTEREANHNLEIPGLAFSLPDSPLQWLNMAALAGASDSTRRLVSNL